MTAQRATDLPTAARGEIGLTRLREFPWLSAEERAALDYAIKVVHQVRLVRDDAGPEHLARAMTRILELSR